MNKKNNFNIIRWIGITLVLYGHQYVLLGLKPPVLFGNPVHGIGVNILFAISGYLIYNSYRNSKNWVEYLKKRVARIFPALFFVIIMTVCICYFVSTIENSIVYFKASIPYILHNVMLSPKFELPGVFSDNYYPVAVNGSLWTLPIEFVCYLVIPFIYILCNHKRGKLIFTTILASGFVICSILFGRIDIQSIVVWGTDWVGAWKVAIYFFVGIGIAVWNSEQFFNIQISVLFIFILACVRSSVLPIFMILVICYTVFSFAFAEKPLFSRFMNKMECSYGMYLWGFVVQQMLIKLIYIQLGKNIGVNVMFLLSWIITFILSVLTYYIIEKNINKMFTHVKGGK